MQFTRYVANDTVRCTHSWTQIPYVIQFAKAPGAMPFQNRHKAPVLLIALPLCVCCPATGTLVMVGICHLLLSHEQLLTAAVSLVLGQLLLPAFLEEEALGPQLLGLAATSVPSIGWVQFLPGWNGRPVFKQI